MTDPRYSALPALRDAGLSRGVVCQVARLYEDLLGRPADSGGFTAYAQAIAGGTSFETLIEEFLAGPEFRARGVPPPADLAAYAAALRALGQAPCPIPPSAPVLSPDDPDAYTWWLEAFERPFRDRLRAEARAGVTRLAVLGGLGRVEAPAGCVAPDEADWLILLPSACQVADTLEAEIARRAADPSVWLLLADEDQIRGDGTRHTPWFRAEPDAVLAAPHALLALRAEVARRIGVAKLRALLEAGADPLPDILAMVPEGAVGHIPRVLVHRLDPPVARPPPPGPRRAARLPSAAVLIPTRNRVDLLAPLIEDLRFRTDYDDLEIVVMDNDSDQPDSRAYLDRLADRAPGCRVVRLPGPFNWAEANNRGAASCSAEVLVFLNNDMRVLHPDWLAALVTEACQPGTGVAGAGLFYPDGTVQHAGMVPRSDGTAHHVMRHAPPDCRDYHDLLYRRRRVGAVTGACMAMRRAVLEQAGGLDATRFRVTCSDADLCLRVAERGLDVIWTPAARLMHLELATRGEDLDRESRQRAAAEQAALAARWPEALRCDRCWSPNLAYTEGPPALACPPRWDTAPGTGR